MDRATESITAIAGLASLPHGDSTISVSNNGPGRRHRVSLLVLDGLFKRHYASKSSMSTNKKTRTSVEGGCFRFGLVAEVVEPFALEPRHGRTLVTRRAHQLQEPIALAMRVVHGHDCLLTASSERARERIQGRVGHLQVGLVTLPVAVRVLAFEVRARHLVDDPLRSVEHAQDGPDVLLDELHQRTEVAIRIAATLGVVAHDGLGPVAGVDEQVAVHLGPETSQSRAQTRLDIAFGDLLPLVRERFPAIGALDVGFEHEGRERTIELAIGASHASPLAESVSIGLGVVSRSDRDRECQNALRAQSLDQKTQSSGAVSTSTLVEQDTLGAGAVHKLADPLDLREHLVVGDGFEHRDGHDDSPYSRLRGLGFPRAPHQNDGALMETPDSSARG